MELANYQQIESKIFSIRGMQVMLDRDLAEFYGVKPIRLREQIKRNPKRFPSDFVFQLKEEEIGYLVSQNAIPSRQHLGGFLPYVFTEQGVSAVSGVLKGDKAAEVNVFIMRAFVSMRKFLIQNATIFQRLDQVELKLLELDEKFNRVFKALESGQPEPDKGIFFDGQVFDAYVFVSDLIRKAKSELVLIDNYLDDSVLTLLSKRGTGVKAILYTKTISKTLQLDLEKHQAQYPEIEVKTFPDSHDRFLVIDQRELYHIGASLKDLGKKWFAFSRMDSQVGYVLEQLRRLR